MGKGWIKLHRELRDHWLWESTKEFTKAQAWIDLLLQVNHKSKKVMMDNELVKCNSGETITSETKLADRWGWSRTKVRSFIELLESDDMIKKQTKNKRYTKLSICNYSTYQKQKTTEKQQKNNSETTEKQQKNINKNDKNEKKQYTPDLDEVISYFTENGYTKESAKKFYNYYEASIEGTQKKYWRDSKGNMVKSWKQKAQAVWFKPENKIEQNGQSQFRPDAIHL